MQVSADGISKADQAVTAACIRYIDETVLNATSLHHDAKGDFNQVVLIGDGLDTRPFRLPWPPGTVIFLLASTQAHAETKALLKVRTTCTLAPFKLSVHPQLPAASFDASVIHGVANP